MAIVGTLRVIWAGQVNEISSAGGGSGDELSDDGEEVGEVVGEEGADDNESREWWCGEGMSSAQVVIATWFS